MTIAPETPSARRDPSLLDLYRDTIAPNPDAASLLPAVPTNSVLPAPANDPVEHRSGAAIIAEAAYALVARADVRPDVLSLLKTG